MVSAFQILCRLSKWADPLTPQSDPADLNPERQNGSMRSDQESPCISIYQTELGDAMTPMTWPDSYNAPKEGVTRRFQRQISRHIST